LARFTLQLWNANPGIKYEQRYRPYIFPFHLSLYHIPHGASVLDVGCGPGLFLLLLAKLGRIQSGVGFDIDHAAIQAAEEAAA
jgi:ribosomal protein L11 methylase PrmA